MIIRPEHKAVLLNLRNPELVTAVIPQAKVIKHKGKEITAVPHSMEVARVLNNMGIDIPSPIKYYYKWSGQYTPFHAQEETAAFLTMNNRAFCLNDLGTGKTMSTLWAFDYLKQIGQAAKLLVVSPLSTLERVWGDEVFRHFTHLSFGVLHGTKKRRLAMLAEDFDVYIINHDGIKVLEAELTARTDIDSVVVDEIAQCARNAGTEMWKALRKVTKDKPRLWGLTGTPIPNAPTDAWAQCKLVCPGSVPPYFTRFRETVMRQAGPYKWIAREGALDIVDQAMQPSIRYHRSDCIDLPPVMYQTLQVALTKDQIRMYKDMVDNLAADHDGEQVTAVNEAVKLMKLVQICCGTVYSLDGEVVIVPPKDRLNTLLQVVEDSSSKTIVFCPFTAAVELVGDFLIDAGYTVGKVYGDVKKSERDEIFRGFQKSKDPQVIVAQPGAMSHGLTLTEASTIAWYAPITSAEIYEQANGRITRPGQKHSQLIVNIEGSAVERKMYERLKEKTTTQGLLLDIVRGEL
jgi:SNF2 family DNA or RNA helicase